MNSNSDLVFGAYSLPLFSKFFSKFKRHWIFTKVHLPGEKKTNFQKPSENDSQFQDGVSSL